MPPIAANNADRFADLNLKALSCRGQDINRTWR